MRTSRRAIGIVWAIVLVLALVLASLAFGMRAMTGQATLQARRDTLGETALSLAESALDEAGLELGALANRADHSPRGAFLRFRRGVVTTAAAAERFVPGDALDVPVPRLARELARPALRGWSLKGGAVEARILSVAGLPGANEETCGEVRLTATVAHRAGAGGEVVRAVSVARPFQVLLTSTPRPFDQATLWIAFPRALIADAAFHNGQMDRAAGEIRGTRDLLRSYAQQLRGASTALVDLRPAADALDAGADGIADPPAPGAAGAPRRFEPPFTLACVRDEVDLAQLDLRALAGAYETTAVAPAGLRLRAALRPPAGVPTAAQILALANRAVAEARAYDAALRGLLALYARWQDAFCVLGGGAVQAVAQHAPKLDAATLAARATFRFAPDPRRPDAGKRLVELIREHAGEDRPLCGVLVHASDEPLALTGLTVRGRLVIVSDGPVALKDVRLARPRQDLLTVCSAREVRVAGEVSASVVLGRGARFVTEGAAVVRGNVALEDCGAAPALTGTVRADVRYSSGFAGAEQWEHQAVLVWPAVTQKAIGR